VGLEGRKTLPSTPSRVPSPLVGEGKGEGIIGGNKNE